MEDSERRKAIELLKEMRNSNKAVDGKGSNQETHLSWMYKAPSNLVDREEYLLGKTIDKTFEVLNSGDNSSIVGRTGEQSNVPKRLLEKTDSHEQVDIAKKILEDPLYAIKQKEMEVRKKLLNNPVKLKQIKQLLLERSKQRSSHKKKKKKLKKISEQDLNFLILKKLKKFKGKEKIKALNKIMQCNVSSNENSSSGSEEGSEVKRKSFLSDDKNESSSEISSSSSENGKARKFKTKKAKHKEKVNSSSDSDSSCNKKKEKSYKKSVKNKKHSRKSLSTSASSSSTSDDSSDDSSSESSDDENKKSKRFQHKSHIKSRLDTRVSRGRSRNKSSYKREDNHKEKAGDRKRDHSASESRRSSKNYGLMMPDGSRPKIKKFSPVKVYEKNTEIKTKYVPPPKATSLSEKEREEKLIEMLKNAKQRKKDRERNLASHRKKQDQEENSKTYDDDFMRCSLKRHTSNLPLFFIPKMDSPRQGKNKRRQICNLTSQGTMSDRIKSNINNIQRSKSSMDTNFMTK